MSDQLQIVANIDMKPLLSTKELSHNSAEDRNHPSPADSVTVTLSVRFGLVTVAVADFTFYSCAAVQQVSGSMP